MQRLLTSLRISLTILHRSSFVAPSKPFSSFNSKIMAAKDIVEGTIADNKITIFSKSYCPYCKSAKATLRTYVAESDIKILELDEMDNGTAIQDYLREKTGQSTVPNVFINALHVGGNDAVQAAKNSNKLQQLIETKA